MEDGKPTRALEGIREALRPLRELYGNTPANEFGPKALKAVRQYLIGCDLSRNVINSRIGRIKRMFKWAVAEKMVPPSLHHGLQAVAGINYGLQKAKKDGFVIPHWHPHQLRHNRGTEVRRKYGIEAAQVALGHAHADVTEVYAEKNLEQAEKIAKEMGSSSAKAANSTEVNRAKAVTAWRP